MAANIEFNKNKNSYSFYSLKENPWHELGTVVKEAKTPEEIIHIANMDYTVNLAPMYASFIPAGTTSINKVDDGYLCTLESGETVKINKKGERVNTVFCTYRTDNLQTLGVVGNRYEAVQNTEAMEFIYHVCKNQMIINPNDVIIETAGVLGIGERIFVTAKLPSYNIAKDDIDKYILFTTSHDGSGSIRACFTNIRVVCNNTLNMALKNCTNMICFKHTKNVKQNLIIGAKMMRESLMYSDNTKAILEAADKVKVDDKAIMDYIFDITLDANQKEAINKAGGLNKIKDDDNIISTRKYNQIIDIRNFVDKGPGQDIHRGTMYWLFNGVTSYLNNGINYKDNLNKFDSIIQGNSFKIGQKALDNLVTRLSA